MLTAMLKYAFAQVTPFMELSSGANVSRYCENVAGDVNRGLKMDFAKNLMKKYGWKEGEGLGKNSDGIEKPLKAHLKYDNTGLGHDAASDFNNHWWERVYNEAANNLDIKNADSVVVTTKNKDALEISTEDYSVRHLKKLTSENSYKHFLKTATLSGGGESEHPERIEIDEIKLPKFQPLTDEELFAACGGRTAHKGARHGLKLSGKLARIEQQERDLQAKLQMQSMTEHDPNLWQTTSKKKRKRKRDQLFEIDNKQENEDELADVLDITDYATSMSKKKRKETCKRDRELSSCLQAFSVGENQTDNGGDTFLEHSLDTSTAESKKRRKRKKRSCKSVYEATVLVGQPRTEKETIDELDDQLTVNSLEVNISDSEQSTGQSTKKTKSKKVKKQEKRMMKKLTSGLENKVVITD